MARLLIAASLLLQGRHSNGETIPGTLTEIFPDVADGSCVPGSYCSAGAGITTPKLRGLCVNTMTGAGQQCWDACNTAHGLDGYGTSLTPATQKALAMMVKQLRTAQRYGSCPGAKSAYAEAICNAGERCTPPGLTFARGICITITDGQNQTDQCLDMCDTSIPLATYKGTPGKEAGTLTIVRQVQAGRDPSGMTTCPGVTVWVWLWFPILLCCCIGVCAASYVGYNYYKGRLKPRGQSGSAYREPVNEPYVEDSGAPYVDYEQQGGQYYEDDQMPPPQTMEAMEDAGPMPVLEPQVEPLLAQPMYEEKAVEMNIFDQPNLMGGLAPLTVAAPAAYPMAGSNYITSYAAQPQMTTAYPTAGSMTVQPQYGQMAAPQYSTVQLAPTMTTQPTYGAYGAYGGAPQMQAGAYATTYPATTSMRIG